MYKFVFVVPSFNNQDWYKKNLDSIYAQKYPNYRIIYIDDCSTDDTYKLVEKYQKGDFTLIRNRKRMFQAYNRYMAYHMCEDDEICCMVDGDDWLLRNDVLNLLCQCYQEYDTKSIIGNIEVTYGQFVLSNRKDVYGIESYSSLDYRKKRFIAYHLRTGYAKLFKQIPESYLKDEKGNWLDRCSDIAEMFCVLELSKGKHRNLNVPVYVYNIENSMKYQNSWFHNKEGGQRAKTETWLRSLKPL
jgi:glycosyltransferase involved in cell wall biosynthesis